MRLRDHPLLVSQWPPAWFGATVATPKVTGEIGVLKRVVPGAGRRDKCFLFVEHSGNGYIGTLQFRDPELTAFLHAFFAEHVGRSLEEIGLLDLPDPHFQWD